MSPATSHVAWRALRSFYAFLAEEDDDDIPNPMRHVKAPRVPEPATKVATQDEYDAMMTYLDRQAERVGHGAVVRQAQLRRYVSSEHFTVDGTLLNAWASHKSFKPKDGSGDGPPPSPGHNAEVQWHGQQRSNDTHASTTDPEARLYRKSHNTAATLTPW